jgi:peptidyl-prolyl cis-trans isomerase B (cyclophilin B)
MASSAPGAASSAPTVIYILFIGLALMVSACGSSKTKLSAVLKDGETPGRGDEAALILYAESRSSFDPRLTALLADPDPLIRARLALALGRIRSSKNISILNDLLNDRESEVRQQAAFAAAQLLTDTLSRSLADALVARMKIEPSEAVVVAIINALSRTPTLAGVANLIGPYLGDPRASVREAAIGCVGRLGVNNIDAQSAQDSACNLLTDSDKAVRLRAAATLAELKGNNLLESCRTSLIQILRTDPDDETRIQVARALTVTVGLSAELIDILIADGDFRVSAAAFDAIAAVKDNSACEQAAQVVGKLSEVISSRPELKDALFVQGLNSALLSAMRSCGSFDSLKIAATKINELLTTSKKPESRMVTSAICSARALSGADDIDILGCDEMDSRLGKKRLIAKLRVAAPSETNIGTLTEMIKDADPAAAIDALDAALKVAPNDAARTKMVLGALSDERTLLVLAALLEIEKEPSAYSVADGDGRKALPEIKTAVEAVVSRYKEFSHAFMPLVYSARVAAAVGDAEFTAMLLDLLKDTRLPVRNAAIFAVETMKGIAPQEGLPPLTMPDELEQSLAALSPGTNLTAVLQLTSGDVVAVLYPDEAPLSVADFADSAKSGYYNNSFMFRVVPGEAVFLGDPTGSGLGDPGRYVPPETTDAPVERGSIVILYDDIHIGVGRVAVALRRMPEWDGNAAIVGRITSGIELMDRAVEGDSVMQIHISEVDDHAK